MKDSKPHKKGITLFETWSLFILPTIDLRDRHIVRNRLRKGIAFVFLAWKLVFWKERDT